VDQQNRRAPLARRRFLVGLAALASVPLLPLRGSARSVDDSALVEARLVARAATSQLAPKEYPGTAVWGYNGSVPGPVLRVRHGGRLRVMVENRLDEGTTVHWHGVRVPNAMDGVPVITQPPIEPQGSFMYEFVPPDAGTFLYHPNPEKLRHGHSFRVVARNDRPSARREWLDTVLLAPRETAEIAFVADNPGDWMFHCHVLEHQASGMMACIRVI